MILFDLSINCAIFALKSHQIGIYDKVGNAIKERRKILKITQRTLAELAGVGINTLTKIERGEGNPTIEVLEKILDTLGLELQIGIKQRNEL